MAIRAVIDTDVVIAGLAGPDGSARQILRACLRRQVQAIVGHALFLEYVSVFGRDTPWRRSRLTREERAQFLEDFAAVCEWTEIYYSWRPNLADEADNHVLELAVAGAAEAIVTRNVRDFRRAELEFPQIAVLTPERFLESYPCPP